MDPVSILLPVLADVEDAIGGVAVDALGVAAGVLGLVVAWRVLRKYV